MTSYTGMLRCPRCHRERSAADPFAVCAPCAAEGVHVNPFPVYDYAGVSPEPIAGRRGTFAWQHLLPLPPEAVPVTLGEGDTPLVELGAASGSHDLATVWIKDESRNPTWSYKDRLIAVAVTQAKHSGASTVAVASTGNHGAAAAAYAARAGLECVVLTLSSVPATMKTLMQSYGATVVALHEPRDRWKLLAQGVAERGWVPLSGFVDPPAGSNPFGVDGYKTIAYEIVRDLGTAPSAVVAPTAYGDGLAGIMRGFEDMVGFGLIPRVPKIIASEPFGPYTAAMASGFDPDRRLPTSSSVSFSIATPVATFQGYDVLKRSGGGAVTVDDQQVMAAQAHLARTEGLYLEASSATTYAALSQLRERDLLAAGDSVVLLGTSTGLKDVGATARLLPAVPEIGPTMGEIDAALGIG